MTEHEQAEAVDRVLAGEHYCQLGSHWTNQSVDSRFIVPADAGQVAGCLMCVNRAWDEWAEARQKQYEQRLERLEQMSRDRS